VIISQQIPIVATLKNLGLATVDRIRRTYGDRITVPVTVPAAAMGACSRTRYTDSR
jgi:hypothetical protein